MAESLINVILASILHLSDETSPGMDGLLHAGLLHTGGTAASAGADQGRRHCPHSTGPWN
jgi:hypothetical protein